ncbi:Uncharacterised protein [uncultured archaeon]|nr:Uncharacterised protein [uncultured archaeon]
MKTILFYWSRGAETRVRLLKLIEKTEKKGGACYLNTLARQLRLSHVAIKKHLDLLVEGKYVRILNPKGKPHYLALTEEGKRTAKEFSG